MSRFTLSLQYLPQPLDVELGFDDYRNEFFLNVSRAGEQLYSSLVDETPDKDGQWLALRLAEWAIVLPAAVYHALAGDAMGLSSTLGQTNAPGHHDLLQLSPLHAQLVRMKALQILPTDLADTLMSMSIQWLLCPEPEHWREGRDEAADRMPLLTASLNLLLPRVLVPEFADASFAPVLSDAELLALLQRLEPAWPAR